MITFLLLSALSHAFLRDPGEMPGPRFRCDQAKVNACQSEHQLLEAAERRAAAALEERIRLLSDDKGALSEKAGVLAAEVASLRATLSMAERELAYSEPPSPSEKTPIFSGGPLPEEIFLLSGPPLSWSELHGDSRRARLQEEKAGNLARKQELSSLLSGITRQISDLEQSIQALRAASDGHLLAALAHASMCREGCKARFCPEL